MTDSLTPEERSVEQSKLRHDADIVRAYGEMRPDEWCDFYFENEPTVRIVSTFAANVEAHKQELGRLVEYPGQLEVRPAEYSHNQLQAIRDEVRRLTRCPGIFHSLGTRKGRVHIWLAADQEELAATLLAQYGNAVELKVGNFSYPMLEQTSSNNSRPTRLEVPLVSSEGVDVELADDLVVESGRSGRGTWRVANLSAREVVLDTNGAITGRIVDPVTGAAVGGYVGMHAAPLHKFRIAPHETVSVPLLVGTASFKRELGFAVPPGEWMIEAVVKVHDIGERRTPLLPITIIERAPQM